MMELKISYFKKSKKGHPTEGFYAFKKPNIWYPVLYFRKPKHTNKKIFEAVKQYLIKT